MKKTELTERIKDAEVILVGLGEEWNRKRILNTYPAYTIGSEVLEKAGAEWLLPAYAEYLLQDKDDEIRRALHMLTELLEGKNYFVLSTSTDSHIADANWREGRLVMPCGTLLKKQCSCGCESSIAETDETDQRNIAAFCEKLENMCRSRMSVEGMTDLIKSEIENAELLGKCEKCGKDMQYNTVYADNYDEAGYLDRWSVYTKWLSGTVNRKLLVLELGVGMQFPTVIRWPFEKVAFFNQKSFFIRINEKLYQMTEELSDRGTGIAINAIDYLNALC